MNFIFLLLFCFDSEGENGNIHYKSFVRIFGGFATEDIIWEKEFQLLAKLLVDAGETNVDFLQLYR